MGCFKDTVTIYNQISENEWKRTVVKGVQWTEKTEKLNNNGKINIAKYISVTFPKGTYDGIVLDSSKEEDAIFYGEIEEEITQETSLSDLLAKYFRSGIIKSVKDNTNHYYLPNIKAVVD